MFSSKAAVLRPGDARCPAFSWLTATRDRWRKKCLRVDNVKVSSWVLEAMRLRIVPVNECVTLPLRIFECCPLLPMVVIVYFSIRPVNSTHRWVKWLAEGKVCGRAGVYTCVLDRGWLPQASKLRKGWIYLFPLSVLAIQARKKRTKPPKTKLKAELEKKAPAKESTPS